MSALDELKRISFPSDLDCAVMFYGDDDSEEAQTDADIAANELLDLRAELLALRERVAKLEKVEECAKKLVALRGVAHGAWVIEELEAALKSQ